MEGTLRQGQGRGRGQKSSDGVQLNPLVIAALATVVVASLVLTLIARMTGYDASVVPESPVAESRLLGFRDLPGGVVEVYDWEDGKVLRSVESGEGSFLRGVVRSLVRQRRGLDSSAATAFVLNRHTDGRLVLADPETGESIDLIAFGPTNLQVFSTLLESNAVAYSNPGRPR